MDNGIKNAVKITDKEAQYDEKAKHLLGQKIILAHILARTVKEFKGMKPQDIVPLIEGNPQIGIVPADPGMTNTMEDVESGRITGINTENSEINEGLIRFDIVFYVNMPSKDGEKSVPAQMVINVEAQKDNPEEYKLLNRAIFYVCRLVSSQKERDFVKTDYDGIKKVYSIWICMNMEVNSINHVHLTQEQLMGDYNWQGKIDMLNIIFIGLSKELPEKRSGYGLHRLLGALLSNVLSVKEKLGIIENEYNISLGREGREEMEIMCNLGQGVFEDGFAQGEARGIALGEARGIALAEEKMIINMYKEGFGIEAIAKISKKKIDEVQFIIDRKE